MLEPEGLLHFFVHEGCLRSEVPYSGRVPHEKFISNVLTVMASRAGFEIGKSLWFRGGQ